MSTLTIVPVTFRAASAFVAEHHRHNKPPRGHKFSIGVCDSEGVLRGVAMVGRPVSRHFDDGLTAEVNRTCTDGCPNANSALYGAAWRIASAMGYRRLVTYTQAAERGRHEAPRHRPDRRGRLLPPDRPAARAPEAAPLTGWGSAGEARPTRTTRRLLRPRRGSRRPTHEEAPRGWQAIARGRQPEGIPCRPNTT